MDARQVLGLHGQQDTLSGLLSCSRASCLVHTQHKHCTFQSFFWTASALHTASQGQMRIWGLRGAVDVEKFCAPSDTVGEKRCTLTLCLQDADGDGYLSFDELRQALERDSDGNDPGIARVADMAMKALDVSGDGFIEYHEFLAAAIDRQRILTDHTLAELFGEPPGLFALWMLRRPQPNSAVHINLMCVTLSIMY